MLHGRLVHVGETVTVLQILGGDFYHNVSGGRVPSGPAGEAVALPRLPSRYYGEGRAGKGTVGNIGGKWSREGGKG